MNCLSANLLSTPTTSTLSFKWSSMNLSSSQTTCHPLSNHFFRDSSIKSQVKDSLGQIYSIIILLLKLIRSKLTGRKGWRNIVSGQALIINYPTIIRLTKSLIIITPPPTPLLIIITTLKSLRFLITLKKLKSILIMLILLPKSTQSKMSNG